MGVPANSWVELAYLAGCKPDSLHIDGGKHVLEEDCGQLQMALLAKAIQHHLRAARARLLLKYWPFCKTLSKKFSMT